MLAGVESVAVFRADGRQVFEVGFSSSQRAPVEWDVESSDVEDFDQLGSNIAVDDGPPVRQECVGGGDVIPIAVFHHR